MMTRLLVRALAMTALLAASPAVAQSVPQKLPPNSGSMLQKGYVPTPAEWTNAFTRKQDIQFTAPNASSSATGASRAGHALNVIDDFGATCDGVTNDSAAFQSALNSGMDIIVPSSVTCVVGNLVFNSGSGQTFETNGASLNIAAGSSFGVEVEGYQPNLRGFYINEGGAAVSQTTVSGALATSVSKAYVVSPGSGGSSGTCALTGTTGTGTKFVGSISYASLVAGATVSVTTPGAYSANPTNSQAEPVTNSGCGSLTGVTLAFDMSGPTSISVASASNGPGVQIGQRYQLQEINGAYKRGFVMGVAGTTITLSDGPDVPVATGAPFWATFGTVYVTNAYRPTIDNVRCNGAWGCFNFDDPNAGSDSLKGVNFGTVLRPGVDSARMFGMILGRNVQALTVVSPQITGGWTQADNFIGTGAQTNFALSYLVNLKREMSSVKVDGVTKIPGTDYTINANGLGVTFASAPANSAAVTATYFTYGGVGLEIDCNGAVATACGGNTVSDYNFLQWSDDIYLNKSGGDFFGVGVTDAAVWGCITADGTTGNEYFYAANMYWCANQIRAKNSAAGVSILAGSSALQPSSYPASGIAGSLSSLGAGTSVDWPGVIKSSSGYAYSNANAAYAQSYNGQTCWGCPPGTAPSQVFEWYANGNALTWNGQNTLNLPNQYSYINLNVSNGQLAVQSSGSNGVVSLQGAGAVNLTVNSVTALNCTTSACAFGKVVGLAPATWTDIQPCTIGQISVDANYLYVCTGTNTVKRVALSAF